MSVFVDTSAFYALLVEDEAEHRSVARWFHRALSDGTDLVSSNYVVIETLALIQSRFGLDAVRDFQRGILPLVDVRWIDPGLHRQAMDRLLKRDQRSLSFVDAASFVLMDQEGIRIAFALDSDFRSNGYDVVPPSSHPEDP